MIKPLGKNVALLKEEVQETFVNGIYLQEDEKNKSNVGKVAAISEEVKNNKDFDIKLNNKVLYREYAGTEVEHAGQKYVIVKIEDVLAIVEDN